MFQSFRFIAAYFWSYLLKRIKTMETLKIVLSFIENDLPFYIGMANIVALAIFWIIMIRDI